MNISKISLGYLFIVALLGTWLRSVSIVPLPFEYEDLVHAHSHVAFQGWIYTIMILLLTSFFLSDTKISGSRYRLQFQLTALVMIGVLVSFSLQGYGVYSIVFSTMFQLLNYWFIYSFLRDTRQNGSKKEKALSLRFVRFGLWLGVLSTFVPLAIGVSVAQGQQRTEWYESLVYAFLHLQYNGWFLFVAMGLFYRFLEKNDILFKSKYANRFFVLSACIVIPAIVQSLLGMSFAPVLTPFAVLISTIQLFALVYFVLSMKESVSQLLSHNKGWSGAYLLTFVGLFLMKTLLQSISSIPVFQPLAFGNKFIILAYLHLSLIGVLTFLFLFLMIDKQWLSVRGIGKLGHAMLIPGFLVSELLLVIGGLGWFYDPLLLSIASAAMALGILLLLTSPTQHKWVNNGM